MDVRSMNGTVSWKTIAVVAGLIGLAASAGWAIDARMDRKINDALTPIRADVREIRIGVHELVRLQLERR